MARMKSESEMVEFDLSGVVEMEKGWGKMGKDGKSAAGAGWGKLKNGKQKRGGKMTRGQKSAAGARENGRKSENRKCGEKWGKLRATPERRSTLPPTRYLWR